MEKVRIDRGSLLYTTNEMQKIIDDHILIDMAEKIIAKDLKNTRKIVDVYFKKQDETKEHRTINDIKIMKSVENGLH